MRLAFNGGYWISNAFGIYDPVAYARYPGKKHPGTDFVRPADTPLVAGMSGKVSTVRSAGKTGRGNEVVITNGNKQRKACHLNRIDVKDGQWVEEGQQIGLLGYTGYVVDAQGQVGTPQGAHLHDELLIDGIYVNLMDHLGEEEMAKPNDKEVRSAAATYNQKLSDAQVKYYTERPWETLLNDFLPAVNAERLALLKQVGALNNQLSGADKSLVDKAAKYDQLKQLLS